MKVTSWRTTASAAVTALTAFLGLVVKPLLDDNPATTPMWAELVPIVATAWGLAAARDNKVSSEQAGAVKPAAPAQ